MLDETPRDHNAPPSKPSTTGAPTFISAPLARRRVKYIRPTDIVGDNPQRRYELVDGEKGMALYG